jgi:hypothetical protein
VPTSEESEKFNEINALNAPTDTRGGNRSRRLAGGVQNFQAAKIDSEKKPKQNQRLREIAGWTNLLFSALGF